MLPKSGFTWYQVGVETTGLVGQVTSLCDNVRETNIDDGQLFNNPSLLYVFSLLHALVRCKKQNILHNAPRRETRLSTKPVRDLQTLVSHGGMAGGKERSLELID